MSELTPVQDTPKQRKILRFVDSEEGQPSPYSLAPDCLEDYKERFKNTLGINNPNGGLLLLNQMINALPKKMDLEHFNQVTALLASLEPEDPYEGILIQQMTTCHLLHLEATRCAFRTEFSEVKQAYMKQAMQLARTYAQLLETLTKKRNKGNQKITVQHVNVEGGGQAIVGNVQHGGKG